MRHLCWLVVAVVITAACGTGSTDLDVAEPTATLFPEADDTATDAQATTTTVAPVGAETFDPADLPGPRREAPGVVMLDGIAAPVTMGRVGGWTIATPCEGSRDGSQPDPVLAMVALDPLGDAGTDQGRAELARNAVVADAVRARLGEVGVDAIVTRDDTADVPASFRSSAAAAAGALVVVSVALVDGLAPTGPEPGLEIVHPAADEEARRLAGLLYAAVDPVIARLAVDWPSDVDAGVRAVLNQRGDDYFTILRDPGMSSRVVLHLPVDPGTADVFADPRNVAPVADAMADAIVQHLVSAREGSGFVAPPEVVRDAPATEPATVCVDPLVDDG